MAAPGPCADGPCCSHHSAVPTVQQTLEEMDFERGEREGRRPPAFGGHMGAAQWRWESAVNGGQRGAGRGASSLKPVAMESVQTHATPWVSEQNCAPQGSQWLVCWTDGAEFKELGKTDDFGTLNATVEFQSTLSLLLTSVSSLQHYASRNGHYAVCQFLLESGAKCDAQTHGGATALHRASYCGHTEIARLLLSYGSDPQLTDDDGMTSLHKAAEKGHMDICSLLLQHSPALKAVRDQKARLACDLLPCNSDPQDLLAS
nr:ankyrin repeat domain-containing protein 39 [Loxodonta africana]